MAVLPYTERLYKHKRSGRLVTIQQYDPAAQFIYIRYETSYVERCIERIKFDQDFEKQPRPSLDYRIPKP